MKTQLLSILTFFTICIGVNAQTLNWENAVISSANVISENENNIDYYFYASDYSTTYINSDGGLANKGISGKAVFNSQPIATVVVAFGQEIDVQSINVLGLDNGTRNWVFKPVRGVGNDVVASISSNYRTIVNLNWTNVTRIEISVEDPNNLGLALNYLIDTINYTPSSTCNINIPDANLKAALLAVYDINYNWDSEISCAEAASFTGAVDLAGKGITDLTGLEEFTQMTELNVSANNFTTFNASPYPSLEVLNSYSSSLTSIDVSANTNLKYLNVDNNLLTSLDVSANTNLTELLSQNNNLTSLDLSNNTALTKLFLWSNNLTSLNVANGNNTNIVDQNFYTTTNPNLTCITVDNVAWSNANWNQIDNQTSFSTNCPPCTVNIPDANFKAFLVADTNINTNGDTEIQCSEANVFTGTINCSSLGFTDLTGIEKFTKITELNCSTNNLTSLDVSANTALTKLYCFYNNLTSLDVSSNVLLVDFRCNNNVLTSIDVSANTMLTWLNCGSNQLSSLNVMSNTDLTTLECYGNQLNSLDVSTNTALESLHCQVNQLTDIDVSNNLALESFACSFNQLTDIDVSNNLALESLISADNQLTSLDISGNVVLRTLLSQNNELTSLNAANGNNSNFNYFRIQNNPSLTCVQVDDVAWSNVNWTDKDATASYSTNCATAGVDDFTLNEVSIYPNPTTSVLNIKMDSNLKSATIYSILGKKVLETTFKNINTSNLNSGLYVIKIASENGTVATKKFMKE